MDAAALDSSVDTELNSENRLFHFRLGRFAHVSFQSNEQGLDITPTKGFGDLRPGSGLVRGAIQVRISREKDNRRVGIPLINQSGRSHAVHDRHFDIRKATIKRLGLAKIGGQVSILYKPARSETRHPTF